MRDIDEKVNTLVWSLLMLVVGFIVGAVTIGNLELGRIEDSARRTELQQYEAVQKRHCVDGEARFLIQMPDQTRKWVRGKTPIPCKE